MTHRLPDQKIKKMYIDGMSSSDIGKHFNCSKKVILRRLKKLNVEIRHKKDLPIDDIINMYNDDKSLKEIGSILNTDPRIIQRRLLENQTKITDDNLNRLLNNGWINKPKGVSKRTSFNLFSRTEDGINTRVRLNHTSLTNHIGIYTQFEMAPEIKGTMSTNRDCSSFLGCHIAERVLSQMFNNSVEVMPYGHKGYDFICGRDYKIDCKSSCLRTDKKQEYWAFDIKRNDEADFFLCLAFDNRDDLKPIHCWLIPGGDINNLSGISIRESTLDKWLKYEQPLNKILSCCNEIRTGGD